MNWISVKDRLPEINKEVILTNGKMVKMGYFLGNIDKPEFGMCSCCYEVEPVTHWAEVKGLPRVD